MHFGALATTQNAMKAAKKSADRSGRPSGKKNAAMAFEAVTVRYTSEQLKAINDEAARRALDRANYIRSAIGEQLDWEPETPGEAEQRDGLIPVVVNLPVALAAALRRESTNLAIDRGQVARMLSLRKARNWNPK